MRKVTTKAKEIVSTVRLNRELNDMVNVCSKVNGVSKSRVINQAVTEFFNTKK
jgi:hypothetical protein